MLKLKIFLKNFLPIFIIFIIWRVGLFSLGIIAMKILQFRPSFPYAFDILAKLSPNQAIWHWANFDGPHYITIAEKGYVGTGLIQAFFPLYPIFIRLLDKIVGNLLHSGLIISNAAFPLALYFFWKLLKIEKIKETKLTLAFLLLFPTSFYFTSYYSESLFFLLTILAFLFMLKKKWFWSAIFCSLASATRLVGIFLMPALLWEFYSSLKDKERKVIKNWFKVGLLALLSLSGFLIFCFYLNKEFHDPFYFARVQNAFGASRQIDKIILLHQVIWRYLKMLFTIKGNNILFYSITQEFISSLAVLGLLIYGWIKKVRKSYLIYGFCSFFLPTLTGNFSSMPRYVSLIFPIYIILAAIKNKIIKALLLVIFACFLIINTVLFVRGYWIA